MPNIPVRGAVGRHAARLTESEILKIASAIVGALALAVTTLWWRSERAHERRHA